MTALPKPLRRLLKLPLTLALRCGFIRRRVAFEIKHHWFRDLELAIPLTDDFCCPIPELDSLYSFSEIFAAEEYGSFLRELPLPGRWIDLGSHTGYFTLYLAWQHAVARSGVDWRALLIDADPRVEVLARQTLEKNKVGAHCQFLSGLISRETGTRDFALRPGMGSSTDLKLAGVQSVQRVRTITPADILAALPPPYDLVKIDIEGAEYDFLECYEQVFAQARAILIEWHASDETDSGAERVQSLLAPHGFQLIKTLRPVRVLNIEGVRFSSGVQLYRRSAEAA
jgi:FkbM family methyltransferase